MQRELAFAHKANRNRALAAEKDALDQGEHVLLCLHHKNHVSLKKLFVSQ